MAAIMGMATYPGVQGVIGASYTCSHGITPGVCILEIQEQDLSNIPGYGTLSITDGARTISLPRCRIATANYSQSSRGRTIILTIQDRRWMFAFGYITSQWNQVDYFPNPDWDADDLTDRPSAYFLVRLRVAN